VRLLLQLFISTARVSFVSVNNSFRSFLLRGVPTPIASLFIFLFFVHYIFFPLMVRRISLAGSFRANRRLYKPISIAVVLNCGAKLMQIMFMAMQIYIFYLNELLMPFSIFNDAKAKRGCT